jgi:hypothetical protein
VIAPLDAYDRQAHLAWYERQFPDSDLWPPYPRTDAEAAEFIAQYAGVPALPSVTSSKEEEMDPLSKITPGQAAHDTWCADDDWDELDDEERDLWEDAAKAAIAAALADLLTGRGLQVEFAKAIEGYVVQLVEGDAVALSTGIGDTVTDALEAAVAGLDGAE